MEAAGEEVTAVNAAVKANKLMQIACGAVYTDEGDTLEFDITNRYNVLHEVIGETSNKVLIFVPFQHTIQMLADRLKQDGVTAEVVNGAVSAGARADIFRRFQQTDDPRVLVIQPQAAAHGVTLTAADTIVWWAPTSSLEIYAQANARIHRSGQVNKCTVVQLEGSPVERHIYNLLDNKIDVHSKIVELYRDILD
jgi:SNF2 family DNA or RNA helicase